MVLKKAIFSAFFLFVTVVAGSSIIYNNCGNNVTIYRHFSSNTQGVYSPNSSAVLCADPASTQFTILVDMVSDEIDAGCDVFVSFDFQREDMFNLDGSIYDDNGVCPETPSDKMSCYDGVGISPHRTLFNLGNDTEISLCSVPLYYPPAPAPAPVSPAPTNEYSVSTIVLMFFAIFGGISLVGTVLFCCINCVYRYEEKKLPGRTDIPRYSKGLAFVALA